MRTQKQIDASRANGAKSNGPKTEEGKAKSSKNATKHALTAADHEVLYMNDNFPHFTEHLESYLQLLNPVGKLERDLVVQIASGVWRLKRVDCLEAALVDNQMDRTREEFEAEFEKWDSGVRQADAVEKLANNGNGLSLMIRYRTASTRALARVLADLRILQRDRLRDEKEGLKPRHDVQSLLSSSTSGWTSTYQQQSPHEENCAFAAFHESAETPSDAAINLPSNSAPAAQAEPAATEMEPEPITICDPAASTSTVSEGEADPVPSNSSNQPESVGTIEPLQNLVAVPLPTAAPNANAEPTLTSATAEQPLSSICAVAATSAPDPGQDLAASSPGPEVHGLQNEPKPTTIYLRLVSTPTVQPPPGTPAMPLEVGDLPSESEAEAA